MVTTEDTITVATEPITDYVDKGPVPFSQPSIFEKSVVDSLQKGNYNARGEIGRGGEGYVCRLDISQKDLETSLAVKVVSTRHHSERDIDALCRQADLLRRLQIPGVQRYVAFEVKDVPQDFAVVDRQYRLFSLYEGEANMAERRGTATEAETFALLTKVLDTTAKLHAQNIVHRDIKPSNIRLDQDSNPILVDFGLAKDLTERTLTATFGKGMIGSYQYMAPEVLFRGEKPGKAADLYSIGATFVEYLSGEPFSGERTAETMQQRLANLKLQDHHLRSHLEALLIDDPKSRGAKCILQEDGYHIAIPPTIVKSVFQDSVSTDKSGVTKRFNFAPLYGLITASVAILGAIVLLSERIKMDHQLEAEDRAKNSEYNSDYTKKDANQKLGNSIIEKASGEDHFLSNDEKKKLIIALSQEKHIFLSQELDWSQKLSIDAGPKGVEVSLGKEFLGYISHSDLEKIVNKK